MPKKTKKEKIIAEYRRKLQSVHDSIAVNPGHIAESAIKQALPPSAYTYQATINNTKTVPTSVYPVDHAMRRDLVKTLILAAVAIAAEVALSRIIGK